MGDINSPLAGSVLEKLPDSESVVISELSKIKAFNYTHRLFLQSFDYSVERLELSVRRHFPPYRVLTASDCSRSNLAKVSGELATDDFEVVAICLAKDRGFDYIYTDDEDRGPASQVLPEKQLMSLAEFVAAASK